MIDKEQIHHQQESRMQGYLSDNDNIFADDRREEDTRMEIE